MVGAAEPSPDEVADHRGAAGLRQRAAELERLAVAADEHEPRARSKHTRAAYTSDWAHPSMNP